ncbi:MAG: plasmid mobilization protein [Almyronema sp.]
MTRSDQIHFLVTSAEKDRITGRAREQGVSLSDFLRSLALDEQVSESTWTAIRRQLSSIEAQLFALRFVIEAELDITFSRPSAEIDPNEDPLEYHFALLAEKLKQLFLEVQQR